MDLILVSTQYFRVLHRTINERRQTDLQLRYNHEKTRRQSYSGNIR
ncbi:hypothetical protein HMPREF1205_03443 [Bacteroides fragilis HMW 616]|nr:hypothetical protein HMPREF1205_03443 [Bacteroides fragilis HMW 616]